MNKINYFTSNEEVSKLLASRIKDERVAQRIKQEELADMADVKIHVVRNFEQHAKINLDNLISLLRALKKLNVFEELFDFTQGRIESDPFEYKQKNKKVKQRVYDAK